MFIVQHFLHDWVDIYLPILAKTSKLSIVVRRACLYKWVKIYTRMQCLMAIFQVNPGNLVVP